MQKLSRQRRSISIDRELLKQAIALLSSFSSKARKRRAYEHACGYPKSYGGDAEVLEASRAFMSKPSVRFVITEMINERKKDERQQ